MATAKSCLVRPPAGPGLVTVLAMEDCNSVGFRATVCKVTASAALAPVVRVGIA